MAARVAFKSFDKLRLKTSEIFFINIVPSLSAIVAQRGSAKGYNQILSIRRTPPMLAAMSAAIGASLL